MGTSSSEDDLPYVQPSSAGDLELQIKHTYASVQNQCVLVDLLLTLMNLCWGQSMYRCDNLSFCLNRVIEFYREPVAFELKLSFPLGCLLHWIGRFWVKQGWALVVELCASKSVSD